MSCRKGTERWTHASIEEEKTCSRKLRKNIIRVHKTCENKVGKLQATEKESERKLFERSQRLEWRGR